MRLKFSLAGLIALGLGSWALQGCYYSPPPPAPPPPPQRVVEKEYYDQYGNVVDRQTFIEDGPQPAVRVEVIPVMPYPTAIWIRGYWFRDRYRRGWVWVPGHWR